MPNMIVRRFCHKSVAVKNKLFVIGGYIKCEVFDSTTNKFTLLKQPTLASRFNLSEPYDVISIGSKLFVFKEDRNVIIYDFENNKWSAKTCEATRNISYFSCVKVPV